MAGDLGGGIGGIFSFFCKLPENKREERRKKVAYNFT